MSKIKLPKPIEILIIIFILFSSIFFLKKKETTYVSNLSVQPAFLPILQLDQQLNLKLELNIDKTYEQFFLKINENLFLDFDSRISSLSNICENVKIKNWHYYSFGPFWGANMFSNNKESLIKCGEKLEKIFYISGKKFLENLNINLNDFNDKVRSYEFLRNWNSLPVDSEALKECERFFLSEKFIATNTVEQKVLDYCLLLKKNSLGSYNYSNDPNFYSKLMNGYRDYVNYKRYLILNKEFSGKTNFLINSYETNPIKTQYSIPIVFSKNYSFDYFLGLIFALSNTAFFLIIKKIIFSYYSKKNNYL
jgi:hypothetical protein